MKDPTMPSLNILLRLCEGVKRSEECLENVRRELQDVKLSLQQLQNSAPHKTKTNVCTADYTSDTRHKHYFDTSQQQQEAEIDETFAQLLQQPEIPSFYPTTFPDPLEWFT